jgi:hypothetical protein
MTFEMVGEGAIRVGATVRKIEAEVGAIGAARRCGGAISQTAGRCCGTRIVREPGEAAVVSIEVGVKRAEWLSTDRSRSEGDRSRREKRGVAVKSISAAVKCALVP